MKEMAHNYEKQLAEFAPDQQKQLAGFAFDQQKQFSNLRTRTFFGVSLPLYSYISLSDIIKVVGVAMLLIGSVWVVPMKESDRLDVEIKRRAILTSGTDAMIQRGSERPEAESENHANVK